MAMNSTTNTDIRRGGEADPTPRTLESLYREVASLEDKILLRFENVETAFKGYEEAVRLLQEFANRQPTTESVNENLKALKELTDSKIIALKELIDAKFAGNSIALDAALKTQKEGSDKIESNFSKQFENIGANITTLTKSFEDKITEVKDRYNASQGVLAGVAVQRVETRENIKTGSGVVYGLIGAIAVLVPAAIAVIAFVAAKGG